MDHTHATSFVIIYLMLFFQFKHFIVNFLFPYDVPRDTKKPFYDLSALRHSFFHGAGVAVCIVLALPNMIGFAILAGLFEHVAHHCIDTAECKIKDISSNKLAPAHFRIDVDQLLHQLTYIAILVALKWWNLLVLGHTEIG